MEIRSIITYVMSVENIGEICGTVCNGVSPFEVLLNPSARLAVRRYLAVAAAVVTTGSTIELLRCVRR